MRKYILIICSLFLFSGMAEAVTTGITLLPKPIRIRIAFDIAAPRFNCQSGLGICNVTGALGRSGGSGRSAEGEVYVEGGVLYMSLEKEYMTDKLQQELAGQEYFTVDSEISVPKVWLDKMALKGEFVIIKGKYLIQKYDDSFIINFDIN